RSPGLPRRQVGRDGRGGQGAGASARRHGRGGRAPLVGALAELRPDAGPPRHRREMVVFWSPLDAIVLGLGTRIFGTIDRIRSVSAGFVGFRPPVSLDDTQRAQYAKLRQVRWQPGMASTGYLGGHVGTDIPAFLRKYVVPLLRVADGAKC